VEHHGVGKKDYQTEDKDMNEQNDEVKEDAGMCGPGCRCHCGPSNVGKGIKWAICGAVVLAAVGVLAARISGSKDVKPQAQGFALPTGAANVVAPAAVAHAEGWVVLLKGMDELNVVATNTEAVFVVIPSDDAARTIMIQKEVSSASATITEKGTKMGKYLLAKDAEDYKGVVSQIGAPSVLAMVKGRGMAVVADTEVTQDALLKAFVGASRPRSGCGAGGCGAGGCK